MIRRGGTFADELSAKVRELVAAHRADVKLNIAVLGPRLDDEQNPGSRKRQQIYDALHADGHQPFFPEDFVDRGASIVPFLEQERHFLSSANVDLIIILYTSGAYGAYAEIMNFVSEPRIRAKTAVLYPIEHYAPDANLGANTVREYPFKMVYNDELLASCQLVGECRSWAKARASALWPKLNVSLF